MKTIIAFFRKSLLLAALLFAFNFSWAQTQPESANTSTDTANVEKSAQSQDDWYDPNKMDTNDESIYDEYGVEHSRSIFRQPAKRIYGWLYNIVRKTTGLGNGATSVIVLIIILIAAYFFVKYFLKIVIFLYWLLTLKPLRRYLARKKLLKGEEEYFRKLPFKGDIFQSNMALNSLSGGISAMGIGTDIGRAISAYTLRMLNNGNLKLAGTPGQMQIEIGTAPADCKVPALEKIKNDAPIEKVLYNIYKDAAGKDGTLQKGELINYICSKPKVLNPLRALHRTQSCSNYAKTSVAQLYGLKNYLNDYTLLNERKIVESGLWNEYMVFAVLYGIADKVKGEFKAVCPENFDMNRIIAELEEVGGAVGLSSTLAKKAKRKGNLF